MPMQHRVFTEEERVSFVKERKETYTYPRGKVEFISFKYIKLVQFVGLRAASTLSHWLGGNRFRLGEKTYNKKMDRWPTGKHWTVVTRDFLNEEIGEKSTDILYRHLKGVYIYIPKSNAERFVKEIDILEMLEVKERKKEIARRMHMKPSTLTEFIKKHIHTRF